MSSSLPPRTGPLSNLTWLPSPSENRRPPGRQLDGLSRHRLISPPIQKCAAGDSAGAGDGPVGRPGGRRVPQAGGRHPGQVRERPVRGGRLLAHSPRGPSPATWIGPRTAPASRCPSRARGIEHHYARLAVAFTKDGLWGHQHHPHGLPPSLPAAQFKSLKGRVSAARVGGARRLRLRVSPWCATTTCTT